MKNFIKKLSLSSQKYRIGIRDPGFDKKPIPDPGSRSQKGTGSRIPDVDLQHCIYNKFFVTYQFFPCKKAYYVKNQQISNIIFENRAFYGLDTEPEP
jgi:hypothetical protein